MAERVIVFQRSALCRPMTRLADEPKQELLAPVVSDRKSHRIVSPFFGQTRTTCRVTEITKFAQFPIRWLFSLMTGRGTMPGPATTQREARRMKPTPIFQLARRHEERTSHSLRLLFKG